MVIEQSAAAAESILAAASCVFTAIQTALEENVLVEDNTLAVILASMQSVACEVCHCP